MKTREVLAVAGIAAAAGAGIGVMHEAGVDAEARAIFITARTCALTYDEPAHPTPGGGIDESKPGLVSFEMDETAAQPTSYFVNRSSSGWTLTRDTLACLRAGAWVSGGVAADTAGLKVGQPERILGAYASLQKSEGDHFNPSAAILLALIGGGVGGFIARYRQKRQAEQADKQKAAVTAEAKIYS